MNKNASPSLFVDTEEYIKKTHAMTKLGFSRHTFEKAQKQGFFNSTTITSERVRKLWCTLFPN